MSVDEGVEPDGFLTLPREPLCIKIDNLFKMARVAFVRSPPQSGKTSLMKLYAHWTMRGRRNSAAFLLQAHACPTEPKFVCTSLCGFPTSYLLI